MLTGRPGTPPWPCRATSGSARDFPIFGSVVSYFTPAGAMPRRHDPAAVGHDGVTYAGTYAGFLGPQHDPMEHAAAERHANETGGPPARPARRTWPDAGSPPGTAC